MLIRQDTLARHFWPDGSQLDLFGDPEASAEAVAALSGPRARAEFLAFSERCARLFDAFDTPMMQDPAPDMVRLTRHVLGRPSLIGPMAPLSTLAGSLARQFSDPRLAQLFGRYATYVGGSPFRSPAILALIWNAEESGVWVVEGGMHRLAEAVAQLAVSHGARFRHNAHVDRIEVQNGRAVAVHLAGGTRLSADIILFNGDPRALATGALGLGVTHLAPQTRRAPRALSARVHSFAAIPTGPDLAHHNVFFDADPRSEFDDLAAGRIPRAPTLYLCAEDRGQQRPPPAPERFEMISNAPPLVPGQAAPTGQELETWHQMIMQKMAQFGMTFDPAPTSARITTPQMFGQMFPASLGSLYGQSPHGLLAAFQRPTARTAVPGLYLAGGGTHPGAGVPMATLSGRHAAAAIVSDLTSTSTWAPTAMPGGMSTA